MHLTSPKERTDVGASGFEMDLGMPHGVETVFVGSQVEGSEIMVVDFFVLDGPMMELDGIGRSPEEHVLMVLTVWRVENVGEETLLLFRESKGFGKGGQG